MLSFKKALFGLMMMVVFVLGVHVDASFTKSIVGNTQYQNNGAVNYVVTYTNTGTVPVTVKLTDTLPTSLMPTLFASACDGTVSPGSAFAVSQNGQILSTNYCTLAPSASATMNYSVLILSQSFSSIINTVNATLYSGSTFVRNETATSSFSSYPVLSVVNTFTGLNPQKLNDSATFTIKVVNSGSVAANNIVVSELIPNGFTYASSTLPGTPVVDAVQNTVSWVVPTIPANSSVEYTIVSKLATSFPGAGLSVGSVVSHTGTIATGTTSTPSYITFANAGKSSASSLRIAGIPSVGLVQTLTSPANATIVGLSGSVVGYTITVTNTGTETAKGSIVAMLPSELSGYVASLTPSVVNGNTWTWTGITLAPAASTTITLTGSLSSSYSANRVITNTASFNYDANTSVGPLSNNGVATGLIQGLPNLVLAQTLVKSAPNGQSGDVVVYSLALTNSSPSAHTGSWCITAGLPASVTVLTSSIAQTPCGSVGAGQISFSGSTLPATIIFTGSLNTTLASGTVVTSSGAASLALGSELLTTDNFAAASFTVGGRDLVLSKTVGATTYTGTPGTVVTYKLNYHNNSTLSASGVVVTDTLPSNLSYSASTTPGSVFSGSKVSRKLGTLAAGQSGTISFTALISGYIEGGTVVNSAEISTEDPEINLQNNTASASFTVIPALADVRILGSIVSQGTYLSGTSYTFRFDIANIGGLLSTGVKISDVLPSMFSYVSGSTNLLNDAGIPLGLTNTSNIVNSDTFSLSAGQSGYVLLNAVLNKNILTTTNYATTGSVSSVTPDSSLLNNIAVVNGVITAPVISCSGLNYSIVATSSLTNPVGLTTLSGLPVSYVYSLTNNLALPIESLTVGTTIPSQISLSSPLTPANIVAVSSNIAVGSGIVHTITGVTNVDGITTITTPATFTVKVSGGESFTCNTSSLLLVSQTCGNNVINTNLGEQCENYNGRVLVASGVVFDATSQSCDVTCKIKTTKIKNCAYMDVAGVIKNSCVDIVSQPENPLLTLKKYVNDQDAQDNATAVSLSKGTTAIYKIVVTNSSLYTAYGVKLSDILPAGISYVSNSASLSTISYDTVTRTLTGTLANIPAGTSLTFSFRAVIDNSNGYINNIARVNYVDVNNVTKPEISDPAVVVIVGSSNDVCNNGIKEGIEQCDLGNLPATIGNYLDTSTKFPSFPNRGNICNNRCEIVSTTLGVCGDGVLGRLEQCDLGGKKTINGYLDNSPSFPTSAYNGQTCSSSCAIEGTNKPAIPACWASDTVRSVMKDEYLPFAWELDIGQNSKLVDTASSCAANEGAIIKNSFKCTFELYNRNEEGTNGVSETITRDCSTMMWGQNPLFQGFATDPSYMQNPYGNYYFTPSELSAIVGTSLGEYKISLKSVDYSYCKNGKAEGGSPYARVCQVNVAITAPYLMQKGSVSTKTNSDLSKYSELAGGDIYAATDLNQVDKISSLNYANLSSSMKTLTNSLIAKYEKISVATKLNGKTIKKVPGKAIYIMEGGQIFEGKNLEEATTVIIKGDVTIQGNISDNVLLIAEGTVKFNLPDGLVGAACTSQVVRGVIVAQKGFVKSTNGYKNDSLKNPRCDEGNLQVYGLLVGDNLDAVIESRRSHLNHWFTFKENASYLSVDNPKVKAERREEIYTGASVYIEQNPSLWRNTPPGSDEFLKALNVSRS